MEEVDARYAARIGALIEPLVDRDGPGLVIGVARAGRVLFRSGAGLANIEHGVPNTAATRMRIGSVTKQFACLAALLLADDGLLEIDAPIGRYLPALAAPAAQASLRQLMWHTAGIRCHIDGALVADGLALRPAGQAEALLMRQSALNFAPGAHMTYSNGGYHLLSLALERVSGMRLERLFEERIFAPLGMRATALVRSDLEIHSGMAGLYVRAGEGRYRRGVFPNEDMLGEGGIVSTVDDMLAWLAHLRHPDRVGSAASWALMLERPRLASGFIAQYGLGLFVEAYRGVVTLNHAGNVLGGASHVLTVPAHELDIAIMSNGAAVDPIELANAIVDIVLHDVLQDSEQHARSADFAHLLGDYHAPASGMVYRFEDMDGQLALSTCYDPATPLVLRDGVLELSFSRNSAGHYTVAVDAAGPELLTVCESGAPETAYRLPASAPSFDATLAGSYACPDLDATACITRDGRMTVKGAHGGNLLQLRMLSSDLLHLASLSPGLPRGGVLRIRREPEGVVLELTLARTRGVRFTRTGEAT